MLVFRSKVYDVTFFSVKPELPDITFIDCYYSIAAFRHLKEPQQTLEAMLRPKLTSLPGHIQSVYVQNLLKLYCKVSVR